MEATPAATIFAVIPLLGELAQLVERLHGMQEVTGSNPVFSTFITSHYVVKYIMAFLFTFIFYAGLELFLPISNLSAEQTKSIRSAVIQLFFR